MANEALEQRKLLAEISKADADRSKAERETQILWRKWYVQAPYLQAILLTITILATGWIAYSNSDYRRDAIEKQKQVEQLTSQLKQKTDQFQHTDNQLQQAKIELQQTKAQLRQSGRSAADLSKSALLAQSQRDIAVLRKQLDNISTAAYSAAAAAGPSTVPKLNTTAPPVTPSLPKHLVNSNSSRDEVVEVQNRLQQLGCYEAGLTFAKGSYDEETRKAVMRFYEWNLRNNSVARRWKIPPNLQTIAVDDQLWRELMDQNAHRTLGHC